MAKIYVKKNIIVFFMMALFCCSIDANSLYKDDGVEIKNNELFIFGHKIKTSHDIQVSTPPNEDDTLIRTKVSPDNNNILTTIGFYLDEQIEWEFWLYNITNNNLVKLNVDFMSVRNVRTEWHNSNVLEVAYGGFQWKKSYFFNAKNLNEKFIVENCILYDPIKNIYVSLINSGIEVGFGFEEEKHQKEVFEINFKNNASALETIKDIKIQDASIFISYLNKDGNIENKVLKIDILRNDK